MTAATAIAPSDAGSRWLLLSPALVVLAVGAVGPLAIVVIYSFLTPGDYAGVKWIFSGEAWLNLFLQQDIFDDPPRAIPRTAPAARPRPAQMSS